MRHVQKHNQKTKHHQLKQTVTSGCCQTCLPINSHNIWKQGLAALWWHTAQTYLYMILPLVQCCRFTIEHLDNAGELFHKMLWHFFVAQSQSLLFIFGHRQTRALVLQNTKNETPKRTKYLFKRTFFVWFSPRLIDEWFSFHDEARNHTHPKCNQKMVEKRLNPRSLWCSILVFLASSATLKITMASNSCVPTVIHQKNTNTIKKRNAILLWWIAIFRSRKKRRFSSKFWHPCANSTVFHKMQTHRRAIKMIKKTTPPKCRSQKPMVQHFLSVFALSTANTRERLNVVICTVITLQKLKNPVFFGRQMWTLVLGPRKVFGAHDFCTKKSQNSVVSNFSGQKSKSKNCTKSHRQQSIFTIEFSPNKSAARKKPTYRACKTYNINTSELVRFFENSDFCRTHEPNAESL